MKYVYILILFLITGFNLHATDPDSLYLAQNYTKSEYEIPMRDGAKLFTVVYSPKDQSVSYPVLLNRTPYGVPPYGDEMGFSFRRGLFPQFLREGFIFVFQDVRGRFMSDGAFRHMTPFIENKTKKTDVDESSDAWDTIDWLIKNIKNNNGKVGMWGISYPGYYSSCAAINAHPALVCVSPQAPIGDWFYDDMHHHGAFFLAANFDFIALMDLPRHKKQTDWIQPWNFETPDGYSFFSTLEPLSRIKSKYFGDSIAFWNEVIQHPNYDVFWQERNILPHLKNIKPAMLVVGGWYDAEDLYGTFHTYQSIEKNNPKANSSIVIGPWIHGGWARTDGSFLGNVSFGEKNSLYYRDSIELPFFNYYLKGKGNLKLAEATMFMTGENKWEKFKNWPPENTEITKFYLSSNGAISMGTPGKNSSAYDEYTSDPQKPVPYIEDIAFGMTKEYMTDDQRFAGRRQDVLVYSTGVLDNDVVLAGPLTAHLKVSTSGSDADLIVKLIDVYPLNTPNNPSTRPMMEMSEYQQMIRSEVIRGRFRQGYDHAVPFKPGEITEINLELQDVLHNFKKGHRIMVQIQSTWFPLVDINPQKFVENIFFASPEDFIKANIRVYHSDEQQSYISAGVLK
jgi:putative CocE/NonD family hydrolase